MKKAPALFITACLCWSTAYAAQPDAGGMVLVATAADVSRDERGSTGFLVDSQGHVIASIKKTRAKLFVRAGVGPLHAAQMVAHDDVSNLALLRLDDTGSIDPLQPYPFARDPAVLQRQVYGIQVADDPTQGEVVAGTLSNVRQPDSAAWPAYYSHNALVGETGAGGPLFNNCGEVVGVMVPRTGLLARLRGGGDDSTYAVPIEWLLSRFEASGMAPARADTPCLSNAAQAAAAEEAAAAQMAVEQAAAAAQAAAAQAELDAAAHATTEAEAALAAIEEQLEAAEGASEEERLRLEEELAARQRATDEARAEEIAVRAALAAAEFAARKREEQYLLWGIVGGVGLLLLLLLVWVLKHRAFSRERSAKAAASLRAEEAQADLAAREQEEARMRQTPTVFFDGADAAGQTVALRVPGASIAASGGAIVGRNPAESDFVINHPEVSRRQFRLFTERNHILIEDLGSTNSTRVDGKEIKAGEDTLLADGSRLELSALVLLTRLEKG